MIFSEDAVSLEKQLHDKFAKKRVNLVNLRREFFYVPLQEVMEALAEMQLSHRVLEFNEFPEAEEWRTSENTRVQ